MVGGTKCIVGASRIDELPVISQYHSNPDVARLWPYAAPVELPKSARVPRLSVAPRLAAVAPGLRDQIGEGVSHFEIGHSEFTKAIRLIERVRQGALQRGPTPGRSAADRTAVWVDYGV